MKKKKADSGTGKLLHHLPEISNPLGDIYYELYLTDAKPEHTVSLYRLGTRVLPSIASLDNFNRSPWTSGYIEGIVDASFLQLTPGTRDGIIFDASFDSFCASMAGSVPDETGEAIASESQAGSDDRSGQKAPGEHVLPLRN